MVQVDWMAVIQHWLKAQLTEEFASDILVCVTVLEIANETNFNDQLLMITALKNNVIDFQPRKTL